MKRAREREGKNEFVAQRSWKCDANDRQLIEWCHYLFAGLRAYDNRVLYIQPKSRRKRIKRMYINQWKTPSPPPPKKKTEEEEEKKKRKRHWINPNDTGPPPLSLKAWTMHLLAWYMRDICIILLLCFFLNSIKWAIERPSLHVQCPIKVDCCTHSARLDGASWRTERVVSGPSPFILYFLRPDRPTSSEHCFGRVMQHTHPPLLFINTDPINMKEFRRPFFFIFSPRLLKLNRNGNPPVVKRVSASAWHDQNISTGHNQTDWKTFEFDRLPLFIYIFFFKLSTHIFFIMSASICCCKSILKKKKLYIITINSYFGQKDFHFLCVVEIEWMQHVCRK